MGAPCGKTMKQKNTEEPPNRASNFSVFIALKPEVIEDKFQGYGYECQQSQEIQYQKNVEENQISLIEQQQVEFDQNNYVDDNQELEIRPKKNTKFDVTINSIAIAKKKQESEDPTSHQLKYLIAQERQFYNINRSGQSQQKMDRMTLELKEPVLQQQSQFKQKIINAHHSRERDSSKFSQMQASVSLNQEQPLEYCVLNTEPDLPVSKIYSLKFMQSKTQYSINSFITIPDKFDEDKQLLYKAINDQIKSETLSPAFQMKQRISSEKFLQNVQLAVSFLNEEGLFYVLKEALKEKGVTLILDDKSSQKSLKHDTRYKTQQIIKTNAIQFQAQMKFSDICCLANGSSQIQFELIFKNSASHFYTKLRDDFRINKQLQNKLLSVILDTLNELKIDSNDVIWLRVKNNLNGYSIFITIPQFQDYKNEIFQNSLKNKLRKSDTMFQAMKVSSLYQYFEASCDMLDPWRNIEFKMDHSLNEELIAGSTSIQPMIQGWKLFAVKQKYFGTIIQENFQNLDNIGYVNLFPVNVSERQINMFNQLIKGPKHLLPHSSVLIIKQLSIFRQNSDFNFLQPRSIEVKVYGEKKLYQVILKVLYDKKRTLPFQTGNVMLDSGIVIVDSASSIKLIGILVQDEEQSKRGTFETQ